MRAWIIGSGMMDKPSFYRAIKRGEEDIVICADGGLDHAMLLGITPHMVIGDMDSVKSSLLGDFEVITHSADKDKTDMQLAVECALERGYSEIIMLGATGGRIDHLLGNIMLLKLIHERGGEGLILDSRQRVSLVPGGGVSVEIKRGSGETISVIPISSELRGLTISGVRYPLDNVNLRQGDSLTVSNRFNGSLAKISIEDGMAVVTADV